MLLAGALRVALVPGQVTEDEFPPSAVLMYGAFFSVALSLAVLPLLVSWRRTATLLLYQTYPRSVVSNAEHSGSRDRLRATLDLEGSLFRSPLAIGPLLGPLVTSLVAVVIPQVSG